MVSVVRKQMLGVPPRCHRMPCGGSGNGRARVTGPRPGAFLSALNGGGSARKGLR